MKLTKNELRQLIDMQKRAESNMTKVEDALGISGEWFGWEWSVEYIEKILSFLSEEDHDWISYYMWECDFGNDVREIEFKEDGSKKNLTFDLLWELLSDEMKDETSEDTKEEVKEETKEEIK